VLTRLGNGARISLGGAIVLFISLFMTWYTAKVSLGGLISDIGVNASAFDAFKFTDLLLAAISLGVIAVIVLVATDKLGPELSQAVLPAGALATLLVLFRLIKMPTPDVQGVDFGRGFGIFIGLIGAAAIVVGQVMDRKNV
jgi:hypothetical protein